jgi:hypothetical protein
MGAHFEGQQNVDLASSPDPPRGRIDREPRHGARTKDPRQLVEEDGRIPLLDVGTVARIRADAIKVRRTIDRITPDGLVFSDTGPETFDAIILATGFRPELRAVTGRHKCT